MNTTFKFKLKLDMMSNSQSVVVVGRYSRCRWFVVVVDDAVVVVIGALAVMVALRRGRVSIMAFVYQFTYFHVSWETIGEKQKKQNNGGGRGERGKEGRKGEGSQRAQRG